MPEDIIKPTEYQLSETIARVGYLSTHQRQMVKGALMHLLHESGGQLSKEKVDRALRAFEDGRLMSHNNRQDVMNKLFVQK